MSQLGDTESVLDGVLCSVKKAVGMLNSIEVTNHDELLLERLCTIADKLDKAYFYAVHTLKDIDPDAWGHFDATISFEVKRHD